MKTQILFLVALLALSVLANTATSFPGCPPTIMNSYECAQYIEKSQMQKYHDIVVRKEDTLIIKLQKGGTQQLVDINNTGSTKLYTIHDVYRDIGYVSVYCSYYEGGAFILVNLTTGQIEPIDGHPIVSPNKGFLAATNFGDEAGYTTSVLRIYRLTKPHLTLEWSSDIEPTDLKWISDTKLVLNKCIIGPKPTGEWRDREDWCIKEKISIELKDGQWVIGGQ